MQALIDAMIVAIDVKKSGRLADVSAAEQNFEKAFTNAVAKAMTDAFHKEAKAPSNAFRDAVRKAINPNQLFS